MPLPSRMDLIEATIYAALGVPTLPVEVAVSPTLDVPTGLVEYYKYFPIKAPYSAVITQSREIEIFHTSVYPDNVPNPADPQPYAGDYFYVGVMHHAIRHQIGQNAFNQNLLGISYGNPVADPMQAVEAATILDISTGDSYFEEDFVTNSTRFILGGSGNLSVIFGLGHSDVEVIPVRHVKVVSQMIGIVYLERLLAIRKTGSFASADFKIDTAQLESTLERFRTESKEYADHLGYMGITIG